MEEDLGSGLAEKPRLLEMKQGLYAGKGGCQIFTRDGTYHLTALNEWGDTVEYTSDVLHGPYANKRLVVPQSGQAGMFKAADGQWTAVVR
jgi:hypothetical protein